MFMKPTQSLLLLLLLPVFSLAQNDRQGVYGSAGIGYGSYSLDLYEYGGGSNLYNDQTFSGLILNLGIEKKSAWQTNRLVFDLGGELMGGFGIKSDASVSGGYSGESKGGHAFGIKSLLKMGYLFPQNDGAIVPLIGLGPYFTYINSGGEDADGNYIYGLQGSLGVDFKLKGIVLNPEINFGLASWGSSDEMEQNGQPGLFEIKIKIAKRF
jgi:hypothetical protein